MLCKVPGTVIHFTVMDHDLMWSNDFEGEAFIDLSTVPGLRGELGDGGYRDLKIFELNLLHPKSKIILFKFFNLKNLFIFFL